MKKVSVEAEVTASVWKVLVAPGDLVEKNQELMILESMKMEIPLVSPVDGEVLSVTVAEGDTVQEGAVTAIIGVS